MDIRSGEILEGENLQKALAEFVKNGELNKLVEVDPDDMTEKQITEKKVSLSDHSSKLGKKLTECRRYSGLTKNQKHNIRKRLKGV